MTDISNEMCVSKPGTESDDASKITSTVKDEEMKAEVADSSNNNSTEPLSAEKHTTEIAAKAGIDSEAYGPQSGYNTNSENTYYNPYVAPTTVTSAEQGTYDQAAEAYYAQQGWSYPATVATQDYGTEATNTAEDAVGMDRKRSYPLEEGASVSDNQNQEQESQNGEENEESSGGRLGLSSVPGLDDLWAQVSQDFTDFDSWTKLLATSESCEEVKEITQAYDVFLDRYPLCFGYWKKYSDILKKRGLPTHDVQKVFERGVTAIPLSVDLWIHYIKFAANTLFSEKAQENTSNIRSLYERALSACGNDFKSDRLWDEFVNWERDGGQFANVTAIYDRLLRVPTQKHAEHFEKFKSHIRCQSVLELVSEEELKDLMKLLPTEDIKMESEPCVKEEDKTNSFAQSSEDLENENETKEKVEESNFEDENTVKNEPEVKTEISEKSKLPSRWSEEAEEKMKMIVLERRTEAYGKLKKEIEKIMPFEEQLRRNYFHVKPLERGQLNAWKEYIKSMVSREEAGEEGVTRLRVLYLFERCVITCCYYEDYWLKYVSYLENNQLIEKAQEVFSRAGNIHLPKKINFHLQWAHFEENHGFKENAVKVLTNLENFHREVVKIPVLKAGVYRRMWNLTKASEALQSAINNTRSRDPYVYLTLKLARFKAKVEGDFNGAREVLQQALQKYPVNEKLHTCMVDLEYSGRQAVNVKAFCEACDTVINNTQIQFSTRLRFCERKLELLEDFGTELADIAAARDEYKKLSKEKSSEDGHSANDEPPEKKVRVGAGGIAATSMTPQTSSDPTNNANGATGAGQYPNYYYPWSYYGSQQYSQQYPQQYWNAQPQTAEAASVPPTSVNDVTLSSYSSTPSAATAVS